MINTIHHGDCLELMKDIPDGSADMIICDLPYGSTKCHWDVVIPFAPLWAQYERIIKPNGAIVLTASQPFTSALVMSNPMIFKYELIWEKSKATGFLDAKRRPLKSHESILVFYKNQPTYNPQTWTIDPIFQDRRKSRALISDNTQVYGKQAPRAKKEDTGERLPLSIIPVRSFWSKSMYPTQKPVALFKYLIKTYTNEGDTVLDNCAGSFTTAVAAENTGRNWICIEKEKTACQKGALRIEENRKRLGLFSPLSLVGNCKAAS